MLSAILVACGCIPSKLEMRPVRYDADVRLVPAEHRLDVTVSVELERLDDQRFGKEKARLELLLHPDLEVTSLEADGATLLSHKRRAPRA